MPRMDFKTNYCSYECVLCIEVCPTGALKPILLEDKKLTQLGKSIFVKDNCIVETEKKECGACSEHCPTKAVRMIPYENNIHIPEVKNEYCIGCGACVAACRNASAMLFVSAKVAHMAHLPQGQVERNRRVHAMVEQMDAEGFGNCSNHRECENDCPKELSIINIARLNRQFFKASFFSDEV